MHSKNINPYQLKIHKIQIRIIISFKMTSNLEAIRKDKRKKKNNRMTYIYLMFLVYQASNIANAAQSARSALDILQFTEDTHSLHQFNLGRTFISDDNTEILPHVRRQLSTSCLNIDSEYGQGDNQDNTCDSYWGDCSKCGNYDHQDFTATSLCCACGGGIWCNDNDSGETDSNGNTCQSYRDDQDLCSNNADDDDFTAASLCCQCGGGSVAQNEFNCQDGSTGDGDNESCRDYYEKQDARGYNCVSYTADPNACGHYDKEDFIAAVFCCACNGGDRSTDPRIFEQPAHLYCQDTDDIGMVIRLHCFDFTNSPWLCTSSNLSLFNLGDLPNSMCCACGGGVTTDPDANVSQLQNGLLCRASDYRMFASHPDWDVISVGADVSESGYHMMMSVTFSLKSSPSTLSTIIYVLNGWECRVQHEIELLSDNFVQAVLADPWKYGYYQLVNEADPDVTEAFKYSICLHVLMKKPDQGFYLSIQFIGIADFIPNKEYQINLSSSLDYVPQSLQVSNFIVYFATTDKLFKLDFLASTSFTTLDMTQVIQTVISDSHRFAVEFISNTLRVKIIDSTNTMRLNLQLNHALTSMPVVRIAKSVIEGSLVMCTHEANSSTNNVYFDQVSINGDTVSFSTTDWAQCLAAIGPTSEHQYALFLLMQPDLKVKTVKLTISGIYSKTSAAALPNFLSFDETSTTAYGILFHQEQFIFGVTNYIYDKVLTGNAGFLTSLENYRLNDFYTTDYSSDSGITSNGASTTQVQANESITDGSVNRDVAYAQYKADYQQFQPDRHEYIKTMCHMDVISELKFCLLDAFNWEQSCMWEAVDISQYDYKFSDVCFPFWLKDEWEYPGRKTIGQVYEENGFLKPTAFKAFSLVINGITQLSRTNDNPINSVGESLWISIQLNDRWETTYFDLVFFQLRTQLATLHSAIMGVSETFTIMDFLTEELIEKYQPTLLGCQHPQMISLPSEGLDETCITEETLSDSTLVGDVPWGVYKKQAWLRERENQFVNIPEWHALTLEQQNLVEDLLGAQEIMLDRSCNYPLPQVNYHSDLREIWTVDLVTMGFQIKGEGTKDWGCFALYFQVCYFETAQENTFTTWTTTTFSNPPNQVAVSEKEEAAAINISKPWAEFYMDNLETGRWRMDPPSIEQILSSELEESQISILISRLYPTYQPVEDTQSLNDDNEALSNVFLTEDQISEARSKAQYRKDNDEYQRNNPVNLQYDINSNGVLQISFSRPIFLPKYMLDLINNAIETSFNEDLRQYQATEPDQNVLEETIENQSTVAEQLTEEQQTEEQGVRAEPVVDESTTDQDALAEMNGGSRRRNLSGTGVLRTQLPDGLYFANLIQEALVPLINEVETHDTDNEQFNTIISGLKYEVVETALKVQAQQCQLGFYLDNQTGLCINDNPPEPEVIVEEQQKEALDWYLNTLDSYVNISIYNQNGESKNVDWSIVETSQSGFLIQLSQEDLNSIQQGDELVINLEGLDRLDGGLPKSPQPIVVDLSHFVPVIEELRKQNTAVGAATQMLLFTTIIRAVSNGSLHELWGAINGMQIAANQPIINIEIAKNAAEFSASVAGIVTFDIPGVDMEFAFGWLGIEMSEEDPILMDIDEEAVSDETEIGGVPWSEFKITFMHDPCWARKDCGQSLSDEERTILTRLIDAQEEFGWELHDQRRIAYNQTWKDLKESAMDPQFREQTWFAELSDSQVALVENLRNAQVRQGDMNELQLQPNPLKETKGSSAYFIDGLDQLAFANAYLSRTLGTAFLWILVTTLGLVMLLVLLPFGRLQFAQRAIEYLKRKLLWNVVLRTVMQTSLEFGFCIVFTVKYAEFDGSIGAAINFGYAYLFTILLAIIPFFFIIFYKKHYETFREIKFNRLAPVDEIGHRQEYDDVAFVTCSKFYSNGNMEAVIKKLMKGDMYELTVEITPLEKDQLEFLQSLQSLHYILEAEIIRETIPHKAIVALNGNFFRNFKADMEREVARQEFMDKFGDPLTGFNLEKSIVIWFPTQFILVRIVFVAGSLLLWRNPVLLLLLRLLTSLIGFIIVANIRPYDSVRANKLELMNEVTVIFIIDCIILCTDILNTGNENDSNEGNTPDLQLSRRYIGLIYIIIFSGNITVHMSYLAYDQIRMMIGSCKQKNAMWNNKIYRERAFQKKNNIDLQQLEIKKRSFCTGMCRRVFGTKIIYEKVVIEDVKLNIRTGGAEVRQAKEAALIYFDIEQSDERSDRRSLFTRQQPYEFNVPNEVDHFQTVPKTNITRQDMNTLVNYYEIEAINDQTCRIQSIIGKDNQETRH